MSTFEIAVTSDADRDIGEIFAYVAERLQMTETAAGLVERIYEALHSLVDLPERYPLSHDAFLAKQGFRILPIDNYLVIYVVDQNMKRVIIHRILYGKRNYCKLLLNKEGTV